MSKSPITPPVTDALRAQARANPGSWVYVVDPGFDGGRLVYVYTDAGKATASGYAEHTSMSGSRLAEVLPEGVRIALNPGSAVSAIIDPADILSA